MPSTTALDPDDPSWDFGPVLDLLRSLTENLEGEPSTVFKPPSSRQNNDHRLGNFDAVLEFMGKPINIPKPKQTPVAPYESSSSASPPDLYLTDASSPPNDDILESDNLIRNKEVRFAEGTRDAKATSRTRLRGSPDSKSIDADVLGRLINSTEPIRGETEGLHSTPPNRKSRRSRAKEKATSDLESEGESLPRSWKSQALTTLPSASLLTPAWVTPPPVRAAEPSTSPWLIPPDIPHILVEKAVIKPLLTLTREEKTAMLLRKLLVHFPLGPTSGLQLDPVKFASQMGGNTASEGIHVFVDASNIVIGFYNALKTARGMSKHQVTKRIPFGYHCLSLILERGRSTAKRILCGSLESSDSEPDYMTEARQCGYSVSSLKRVVKVRPVVAKKRGGNGYATSGPSSGSDAYAKALPNVGEQAVDELLHLHMCTSILEADTPSTMVLATGDAAEAEYSGGFQKYVELALMKGWNVELVCWSDGMSHAWTRSDFLRKWRDQFSIIFLDDYREELFADFVVPRPAIYLAEADWTD